jgi:hypothetical protein
MSYKLGIILHEKYGEQFLCLGETMENVRWFGPAPKPTQQEIDQLLTERPLCLLRRKRDELLKQSDTRALVDFPHSSTEIKNAWYAYRQALRDLPQNVIPTLDTDTYELSTETLSQIPTPPTTN